jgi:hypothetical protein
LEAFSITSASTIFQNSPYYAGGGLRAGTAWQVDSPILDAQRIVEKQPIITDGQYGRISIGKYNSIFVGGVCHELGHALGLPHNQERSSEKSQLGTSLMGQGNRTYGDELRKEGMGSFLVLADGLRLAAHPLFTHSEKGINLKPDANFSELEVKLSSTGKSFHVDGKVSVDSPVYAVVGYMDPEGGGDYDAPTATCIPDESGRFIISCDALKVNSRGQLRIAACQANGGRIDDSQRNSLPSRRGWHRRFESLSWFDQAGEAGRIR